MFSCRSCYRRSEVCVTISVCVCVCVWCFWGFNLRESDAFTLKSILLHTVFLFLFFLNTFVHPAVKICAKTLCSSQECVCVRVFFNCMSISWCVSFLSCTKSCTPSEWCNMTMIFLPPAPPTPFYLELSGVLWRCSWAPPPPKTTTNIGRSDCLPECHPHFHAVSGWRAMTRWDPSCTRRVLSPEQLESDRCETEFLPPSVLFICKLLIVA